MTQQLQTEQERALRFVAVFRRFTRTFRRSFPDGRVPLLTAMELANLAECDLDSLVLSGVVLVETGQCRLNPEKGEVKR